MTAIDIAVLGDLAVRRDGTPLPVTGPGRRALLALLATNVGRVVPIEQIVDGLWGAAPPSSAVKVVQMHVSQLRRLLEPGREQGWELLVTHPSGYELAVDPEAVDATRFETAVRATADLPDRDAVEGLREALSHWSGPPFAGIERPFVMAEGARLEQLRSAAWVRCLAGELARGRHQQVESELRDLMAATPLDESVAELLMLALYRGGHQAEALAVHTELRQRLADELGVDPGPAVTRLHERILRHDPTLAATTASTLASPHPPPYDSNLPPDRTTFIGRDEEVAEVEAMVCRQRLTTLTGAGGAGKTRLALRVASRVANTFDGVWLIALATLEDPTHLDGHCLTQLGILDQMDRPPADTLRGWIGDRHLLLVLDNCEHLAAPAADLVDRLLADGPNLHVLATSRQPLRAPDEQQWRVPTLTLPNTPEPDAVAGSEAGRLFVDRARHAHPNFRLDETTAPDIFRICRRLDGIPLAIELAAVRIATMSTAELAAGLHDRFRLLTAGSRTALPRHRTLRATTDWSHGLLTADQQRLLARLSTFVADFDVGAAVDVCGGPPLDARDVPALLADLVDHSLVEARQEDGHTRHRLLETVREYGREQLGDDADRLARRYGDWVARLTESIGANAHRETTIWYGRLDREFLHLQAAFASAMRRKDAETALRIAAGSGWAMIIVGRFHRQREWVRQALALARESSVDDQVMAQGLLMAGAVAGIDHQFDGTLDLLDEARRRFAKIHNVAGVHWAGYWRAATLAEMGKLTSALNQIERTAASGAAADLPVVEANVRAEQAELLVAASVAQGGPDQDVLAEADTVLTRARNLAESHSMQELLARTGLTKALLRALQGEADTALPLALEQLDAWRSLGRGNRLIIGLVATAKVALMANQPEQARPLLDEAIRLIREFSWSGPLRGALEGLASLAAFQAPRTAATLLGAAAARPPTHRWRMPTNLDETLLTLTHTLEADAFTECHTAGATLTFDDVVTLAATVSHTRS